MTSPTLSLPVPSYSGFALLFLVTEPLLLTTQLYAACQARRADQTVRTRARTYAHLLLQAAHFLFSFRRGVLSLLQGGAAPDDLPYVCQLQREPRPHTAVGIGQDRRAGCKRLKGEQNVKYAEYAWMNVMLRSVYRPFKPRTEPEHDGHDGSESMDVRGWLQDSSGAAQDDEGGLLACLQVCVVRQTRERLVATGRTDATRDVRPTKSGSGLGSDRGSRLSFGHPSPFPDPALQPFLRFHLLYPLRPFFVPPTHFKASLPAAAIFPLFLL